MQYYWILKYILHCTFTRKNLVSAYFEGGALTLLLMMLVGIFFLAVKGYDYHLLLFLIGLEMIIETIVEWDSSKLYQKYYFFDQNKHNMKTDFLIVRWFIALDIGIFLILAIYRIAERHYWF